MTQKIQVRNRFADKAGWGKWTDVKPSVNLQEVKNMALLGSYIYGWLDAAQGRQGIEAVEVRLVHWAEPEE